MCASRCLTDSQCAAGEICVEKGACAAAFRGPSPCAFAWRTEPDRDLDGGSQPLDAAQPSDAGGGADAGGAHGRCEADPFEPNDASSEAVPWIGALENLTICSEDRDYFSIDAVPGDEIGARIEFMHAQGDLDLALLFEGRTLGTSQDTTNVEEIRHTAERSGRYVFEVYGFGSEVENTYRLFTYRNRAPCEPDRFEENDNAEEAAPIGVGDIIDANLCPLDASDFFLLEQIGQDEQIQVHLRYAAPPGMRLTVFTPQGQSLFSEAGSGEERIRFTATQAGDCLIQVSGLVQEGPSRPYELVAERIQPLCGDQFEPNDTPGLATPVEVPSDTEAVICPADFDYYAVSVPPSATRIRIAVTGGGIFGSALRPDDFELIGIFDESSDLEVPIVEDADRTLFLLIGAADSGAESPVYRLAID